MKIIQTFLNEYPNELISYEGYCLKRRYVLLPDEFEAYNLMLNCIDSELNHYYAASTLAIGIFINTFDIDRVYFKFGCMFLDKIRENNKILNDNYKDLIRLSKFHLRNLYTEKGIEFAVKYHIKGFEYLIKRFNYVK